eukprot:SAG31_NODE_31143_length_371_cov_1.500000_1_plen_31_part_10
MNGNTFVSPSDTAVLAVLLKHAIMLVNSGTW